MPLNARLYFFGCHFLWCAHSLYPYLVEEYGTTDEVTNLYLLWSGPHEQLAGWATAERNYALNQEGVEPDNEKALFAIANNLGFDLIFEWAKRLASASHGAHQRYEAITLSEWMYCYYCSFLMQVLKAFERLTQELNGSNTYHSRYEHSSRLFEAEKSTIRTTYSQLKLSTKGQQTADKLIRDGEALGESLAADWWQAVHSTAENNNFRAN